MSNPNPAEKQAPAVKRVWEQYRAYAKTSRRLKTSQGQWRRILLFGTAVALLLTPFAKTLERLHLDGLSVALTVLATVVFALMGWLHQEVLGDDSEQPWVRARQTAEGSKALAFRFLGGVSPFDKAAPDVVLKQAETLLEKAGVTPDSVTAEEAGEKLPPVPLTVAQYIDLRIDDQITNFFTKSIASEQRENDRIVNLGRGISVAVVVFGALGAAIAKEWRDIWQPALGAAAALAAAQTARARHRFLIDSYSTAMAKLKFAKTRWESSDQSPADASQLIETVEGVLAAENAGWVQQMLLKPVVPDQPVAGAATKA